MTSISKNVYVDKLDNIVNKYNNTYHSTTKMKPVDVQSSTYIDSSKDNNVNNPKFKIGDIVKTSKYKNIFTKSLHSKLVWENYCLTKGIIKNYNATINGKSFHD